MFSNNPEFKKNVKLEFNMTRFLIPLLVLALVGWIGWNAHTNLSQWEKKPLIEYRGESLFGFMCGFGFFFSVMWGTYLAASSLTEEVKQKTWDFVRMSSLSPLKIFIGKLFGSTSVVWVISLCGVMPLTLFAMACKLPEAIVVRPESTTLMVFAGILVCWMLFSHALSIFLSAHALNQGHKVGPFSVMLPILLLGCVIGAIIIGNLEKFTNYWFLNNGDDYSFARNNTTYITNGNIYMSRPSMSHWYDFEFYGLDMLLLILAFFTMWLLMGAYRTLRKSLMYRDSPWAWVAFLVISSVFLNGFTITDRDINIPASQIYIWPIVLGIITMIATCLSEAGHIIRYKSFAKAYITRDWKELFRLTPLWVISFTLFIGATFISLIGAKEFTLFLISFTSLLALMCRDLLMIHFISWTRNIRRPVLGIIVYMAMMYGFMPALAATMDKEFIKFFYPLIDAHDMRSTQGASVYMTPSEPQMAFVIPSMSFYWGFLCIQTLGAFILFEKRWKTAFGKDKA